MKNITGEEIVVEDYIGIIKKQALFCYRKLPNPKEHEMDDLVSEGCVVFCQTLERYDAARECKFITFFYTSLWQRFAGILKASYRHHKGEIRNSVNVYEYEPADHRGKETIFNSNAFFARLSRPAFLLARELMEPTAKAPRNPFIARREAFKRLDIPQERQHNILNEIRIALSRAMTA